MTPQHETHWANSDHRDRLPRAARWLPRAYTLLSRIALAALLLGLWAAGPATTAHARTITFTNTLSGDHGVGFGNILSLLVVKAKDSEFGSVAWNGTSTVIKDDARNQSRTQSAKTLSDNGYTDYLPLIFNIGEPGSASDITLHDFTLRFFADTGATLFDLTYDAPPEGLNLVDAGGTGQAGWIFDVNLEPSEVAAFYGNDKNRLGQFIDEDQAIENTAGSHENYFLIKTYDGGGGDPPTAVPEPASITLGVFALGGVLLLAGRQKSRTRKLSQ